MENLHEEFYREMQNLEEKINCSLKIKMDLKAFEDNSELISYVEKVIEKNGGRATFTKLWGKGRLDLSIEYLVLKDRYKSLFSDYIKEKSRETLRQYGFEID
ncbi:hypothetical protein [uncultured Clostridium sp.]|uniref:hypothetical protein n=1 Tax=uncultured Clostridium sp. TaxID=59620 RepID=UPI0026381900|nr:hypothetical protein [uncultured Clostridium sp.]